MLLALLLLSLQTKVRPGFLNVLLNPATLLPLLLSTVGIWFLKLLWQRFIGHPPAAAEVLSLPLARLGAHPLRAGSAGEPADVQRAVPAVTALVALKWRALRPVVAGLSLGFAGFLLYAAWAKAPGIAYLPFTFLARPVAGAQRAPGRAGLPGDAPEARRGDEAPGDGGVPGRRDGRLGARRRRRAGPTSSSAVRSSLLKEGQRVEIDGDVDAGAAGVAMVGPVLRVHGYKVI